MDFITAFPLGDDIAVTLLVLAALSLAALIAGAIVPTRLRRDEDSQAMTRTLGGRLGSHLVVAGSLLLWIGIPALILLSLAPGTTDQRILRSALMLVGLLVGPLAAWRGMAVQIAALGLAEERRRRLAPRLGAVVVTGAMALGILPIVICLWFMQVNSSSALVAFAGGAAISALAMRVASVQVDTAGEAAAVLVGADEQELGTEAEDNPGVPYQRTARMFRRGGALASDLVALTAGLGAMGILVGVPVLAGEGVLVTLLGLGVALLAAGVVAVVPHQVRSGNLAAGLRLGGLAPAIAGGIGAVVAAALWLPTAYENLRFNQVGMGSVNDPSIFAEPVTREDLLANISEVLPDISQVTTTTDDGRGASKLLDYIALYLISPNAVVAAALGLGVLVGLAGVLLVGTTASRRGGTVLRAARTSRTGGPLGAVAALGSTAFAAAGALGLLVLAGAIIAVLSAGIPTLALAMTVHAGLGLLIVLAGHAASLVASSVLAHPEAEDEDRAAAAAASTGPRVIGLLAAGTAALATLSPVVDGLQSVGRADTVWEDRTLHAVTPMSLTLLTGVGLGVVAMLLVGASLLDAARRAGASAVVEARAALLEEREELDLADLREGARRAAVPAMVIVVLMPLVAGFGLGPAALPGYVLGVLAVALGLGVWTLMARAPLSGAVDVIDGGRYGGPGSWGYSGALGGRVLTGVLRSVLGATALPLVLVTSLIAAMSVSAATLAVTSGIDPILRWGIALVALLIMLVVWVVAATSPEVDLEDVEGTVSKPLFSRPEEEQEDTLDAMSWEDDDARR